MNVTILASGSKHNCMVVELAGQFVMIDAGLSYRVAFERMIEAGIDPENLSCVLVTHSHGDHTNALVPIARKLDVPVFMSGGCNFALGKNVPPKTMRFQPGQSFKVGKLTVGSVLVPHDAAEPCALTLTSADEKFAMATDLGSIPDAMVQAFSGADQFFIESNHDRQIAQLGEKHPAVLKRVLGPLGHLDNDQVSAFLHRGWPGTSSVILGHLSREDNDRVLCRLTAEAAIKGNCGLKIAKTDGGVD